jgi:propionyl-CoA carboxylase beta chain
VNIIHRKEIAGADEADARRQELISEYNAQFLTPYIAAERGYIDAVIEPQATRKRLVQSLEMLRSKRETIPQRKHGNIPL